MMEVALEVLTRETVILAGEAHTVTRRVQKLGEVSLGGRHWDLIGAGAVGVGPASGPERDPRWNAQWVGRESVLVDDAVCRDAVQVGGMHLATVQIDGSGFLLISHDQDDVWPARRVRHVCDGGYAVGRAPTGSHTRLQ
jgi:hypothetical protein